MEQLSDHSEHPGAAGDGPVAMNRAILVLEAFGRQEEWGVRELGRQLGFSPSTAYHVVSGLERLGLLQRTAGRRYRLGWRAGVLGAGLARGLRPAELAAEALEQLAATTGETAHLGVLDGHEVVFLAKVEGHHAVRLASQVGQRFPAYATASGKALLAFDPVATDSVVAGGLRPLTAQTITDESRLRQQLAAIRSGAMARDREEIEPHSACAAVPVVPVGGAPVRFAVSVSGPRERIEETLDLLERALRVAAADLARRLHGDDDSGRVAA